MAGSSGARIIRDTKFRKKTKASGKIGSKDRKDILPAGFVWSDVWLREYSP